MHIIGVFTQAGTGKERKETESVSWEQAKYLGYGKYSLLPDTRYLNPNYNIFVERMRKPDGTTIFDSVMISTCTPSLNIEIDKKPIFFVPEVTLPVTFKGNVAVKYFGLNRRIISMNNQAKDIEIQIFEQTFGPESRKEIGRAKLTIASTELANEILLRERGIDERCMERASRI
jgi:hypothetical protein